MRVKNFKQTNYCCLQLTLDKLSNPIAIQQMLQQYEEDAKYEELYLNLVSWPVSPLQGPFTPSLRPCQWGYIC